MGFSASHMNCGGRSVQEMTALIPYREDAAHREFDLQGAAAIALDQRTHQGVYLVDRPE